MFKYGPYIGSDITARSEGLFERIEPFIEAFELRSWIYGLRISGLSPAVDQFSIEVA